MQNKKTNIILTGDGSHSVYSEQFEASYHSHHGAIQETRHVFIGAGLKEKLKSGPEFLSILGIGFGSGLNAFMTYLATRQSACKILYSTVEAYPIPVGAAMQLNYPEMLDAPEESAVFEKMHSVPSEELIELSANFSFHKDISRFEDIHSLNLFDLIYFDAFAPGAQPELWGKPMLSIMYRALRKDGIFVTYCAKGQLKRDLKAVGFQVESLPGPPGKREMTRGRK